MPRDTIARTKSSRSGSTKHSSSASCIPARWLPFRPAQTWRYAVAAAFHVPDATMSIVPNDTASRTAPPQKSLGLFRSDRRTYVPTRGFARQSLVLFRRACCPQRGCAPFFPHSWPKPLFWPASSSCCAGRPKKSWDALAAAACPRVPKSSPALRHQCGLRSPWETLAAAACPREPKSTRAAAQLLQFEVGDCSSQTVAGFKVFLKVNVT